MGNKKLKIAFVLGLCSYGLVVVDVRRDGMGVGLRNSA